MTLVLIGGVGHFIADERPEFVTTKRARFFTRWTVGRDGRRSISDRHLR